MAQTPNKKSVKFRQEGQPVQSQRMQTPIKKQLQSGLWLVATPIGNLGDFTPRAAKTLGGADLILAEDTRVTRKLMNLHGISGRVERCDEAATETGLAKALPILEAGGAVAFCSDAGTPGISDPGERLSVGVIGAGFEVRCAPGASAVLSALTISGLPSAQFMFAGFPPNKAGARGSFFKSLIDIKPTLIFYETGGRLIASLEAMLETFGNRPACVARELTKMFEETRRGQLGELLEHYQSAGAPKGEIVIVLGGAPDEHRVIQEDELDGLLKSALVTKSVKDAATEIARTTGLNKREVYARATRLNSMKS